MLRPRNNVVPCYFSAHPSYDLVSNICLLVIGSNFKENTEGDALHLNSQVIMYYKQIKL